MNAATTPTRWSSSARPATWPTRRSFRRFRRMVKRGQSRTCRSSAWPSRLEPRPAQGPGPRQPRKTRRRSTRTAFAKLCSAAALRRRRLQRPRDVPASAQQLGAAAASGRTTSPSRRCLFGPVVVEQLGESGCAQGARVIVEKPFGRDLAVARKALNTHPAANVRRDRIFRIDHYLGKEPVQNMLLLPVRQLVSRADLEPQLRRDVQITMAESFGVQGRGAFYEEAGAIRDVVQNHLLQVLAILTMEPPGQHRHRSIRDEKVKVFQCIPPLRPRTSSAASSTAIGTRRASPPNSDVETFAAVKLEIDSWRWQACRSTSAPASACRSRAPRCSSNCTVRR